MHCIDSLPQTNHFSSTSIKHGSVIPFQPFCFTSTCNLLLYSFLYMWAFGSRSSLLSPVTMLDERFFLASYPCSILRFICPWKDTQAARRACFCSSCWWNLKRFPSTHHTCVLSTPLPRIERTNAILSRFAPYHAPASHRRRGHLVCSSSCSPFPSEIGFSPSPSLLAPLNSTSPSIPQSPSTFCTPRSSLPSLSFLSSVHFNRSLFHPLHSTLSFLRTSRPRTLPSPSACFPSCLPLSLTSLVSPPPSVFHVGSHSIGWPSNVSVELSPSVSSGSTWKRSARASRHVAASSACFAMASPGKRREMDIMKL